MLSVWGAPDRASQHQARPDGKGHCPRKYSTVRPTKRFAQCKHRGRWRLTNGRSCPTSSMQAMYTAAGDRTHESPCRSTGPEGGLRHWRSASRPKYVVGLQTGFNSPYPQPDRRGFEAGIEQVTRAGCTIFGRDSWLRPALYLLTLCERQHGGY